MEFDARVPLVKHGFRKPYLVNHRQFREICSLCVDFLENAAFVQRQSIALQKQNAMVCFRVCELFQFLAKSALNYQAQSIVLVLTSKRERAVMERCGEYFHPERGKGSVSNRA